MTAIVKEDLSPYYHEKIIDNIFHPFSILMDESNDRVDKSCVILVKVLDYEVSDVKITFLICQWLTLTSHIYVRYG